MSNSKASDHNMLEQFLLHFQERVGADFLQSDDEDTETESEYSSYGPCVSEKEVFEPKKTRSGKLY